MAVENEYDSILIPQTQDTNEYAPVVSSVAGAQKDALQQSMFVAAKTEPDRAAEVQRLASKTNLPPAVVDRNFEDVAQKHRVASTDYDAIVSQTPKTAEWMGNPNNASVARDDIPSLSGTEENVKEYSVLSSMYHSLGSGLSNLASSVSKVPALAIDVANLGNEAIGGLATGQRFQSPEELRNNPIAKFFDATAAAHVAEAPELNTDILGELAKGNYSKASRAMAAQFVANAPQQAAIIASTVAGYGVPALIGMGVLQASEVNSRGQATEGVSPEAATVNAMAQGAIESAFESIGTFGILRKWEGAIAKQYGKQVSTEIFKDFGKTLLYSVAGEGNEELLTSAAQDLSDYITGVNPDALTGIVGRAANAGLVGAVSGGLLTGPSAIGAGVARGHQMRQAQMAKDFYTAMGTSSEANALRERMPEAHKDFIDHVTKGTGVEDIFISPEAVDAYFQGAKQNPVQAMQAMGALEAYTQAKVTGADVQIPLATWIERVVGTEHYQGLANDIKFSPGDLSINEAKAANEETKAQVEQAAKEAQADIENQTPGSESVVGADIAKQLVEAGQDPRAAVIHEGFFKSLGSRLGQDPLQLFNDYRADVQAAELENGQPSTSSTLNQDQRVFGPPPADEEIKQLRARVEEIEKENGHLKTELRTSPLTGTRNAKAFNEDESLGWPKVAAFDMDGLKRLNDHAGHEAADDVLRKIGAVLLKSQGEGDNARFYHRSGDEFMGRFRNSEDAEKSMAALQAELAGTGVEIKINGKPWQYRGIGVSFGTGANYEEADTRANAQKQSRLESGHRQDARQPGPPNQLVEAPEDQSGGQGGSSTVPPSGRTFNQSRQDVNPLGFYSKLTRTIEEKMPNAAPVDQVKALLRDMKEEERKWSGIDEFLAGKDKVTKAEVLEFLAANQLQIQEVTKSEALDNENTNSLNFNPKFSQYVLPGGENYREVLFTLPIPKDTDAIAKAKANQARMDQLREGYKNDTLSKTDRAEFLKLLDETNKIEREIRRPSEAYHTNHWDESNVLAHVRLNDRTDADGKKVLFVEEIQSDWHQAGRKEGYKSDAAQSITELPDGYKITEHRGAFNVKAPNGEVMLPGAPSKEEAISKTIAKLNKRGNQSDVPDAPFRKTWQEFALKRIIRMAAEGGYDKVAWTTGEQQAERYSIQKHIGSIRYNLNTGMTQTKTPSGHNIGSGEDKLTKAELASTYGKEVADKILALEPTKNGWVELEGQDLKVGGEGMKGFYDKILVDAANKLGKKFGSKVTDSSLESAGESQNNFYLAEGDGFFWVSKINGVGPVDGQTFDTEAEAERHLKTMQPNGDAKAKVHSIDITEPLKRAALNEGFSLFQDGGQGPRGQIQLMDRSAIIKLSKSADASTFFHESGHYFLEVLGKAAASAEAPKQVQDDYNTLREWMGAKEGEPLSVENHEQFARGFEAYLMEGKAPSSALKQAFTRFKVWLTSVYKTLTNLNVQLTPQVREVMDRLLATDEEIAQANRAQNAAPLFPEPSKFGLTGEKASRYQKAVDDAREAAEQQLTRKVMQEYTREKATAWREERNKIKESITATVNKQRVYVADAILRTGKMPDGSDLADGTLPIKLDFNQVPEELRRAVPRGTMSKEGGVHPDIAAGLFDYATGTQLLQALSTAEPKEVLVNRLADEQMKLEHGDMMTDGTMPEEAMQAIHNDKRAELMRLELEHLASNNLPVLKDVIRQVARRVPTIAQVRERAQATVGGQEVGQIKPFLYERAESKAAKQAGEALAKGDFQAAYEAKLKELFNHELYRASIAAQEDVQKALTGFKKITRADEDTAKTRDMDLVNAAKAVLTQYGIGRADSDADSYLEPMKRYDPDTYETMKTLVDSATQNSGPYKTVAYNDFSDMRDTVNALWDLARTTREIEIDGKKMDRKQAMDELSAGIAARTAPGEKAGYDRAATKWDRAKMGLMGIRAALRRVESWVDSMDGGDPNGAFRKYLFNPISDATGKYRTSKNDFLKKYLDLLKPIEASLTTEEILAPELGYRFSGKPELLGAILHTGNQSNLQKLLRGRGWGTIDADGVLDTAKWDAFLARMYKEGSLTKADYEFAQNIWDLMEELKPGAQKAHKSMYGFYFNEITAQPVTTPFGTFAGGYVPAKADPFIAQDAAIRGEKEALERSNNSFAFPTSGRGATKTRVESYAAPLQLSLQFIPQHIDWALRFTHIEPHVKSAARIVMNKEFRKQLDTLDPTVGGDMLVPWLQRAAQQKVETSSNGWGGRAADSLFREVRRRTGLNIMVANVANTLQQFTGLSIAAVKVPPKHLRNALWSYVRSPKVITDQVNDQSEFMKTRVTGQVFEIQQHIDDLLLNPSKYEEARLFASKHGYVMQAATQNIVDVVTWTGAYDHAIETGAEGMAAVRQADAAVRQTQGSFNAEDISRFETGTPFMRAFTMFYSYFNMQANLLGTEFANITRDTGLRKGAGRALYVYMMGFMVPAIVSELIVKAMAGKFDEDDDDQYVDDLINTFFGAQFRTATAMFPIIGPTVQAGINQFNDKWYDDRITTSPAVSAIESTVSAPHSVYKAITGDGSKKRATRDALTALGLLSGLPVAPLARPAGYLMDYSDGTAQPTGPIDFARGLISGKSGAQR